MQNWDFLGGKANKIKMLLQFVELMCSFLYKGKSVYYCMYNYDAMSYSVTNVTVVFHIQESFLILKNPASVFYPSRGV